MAINFNTQASLNFSGATNFISSSTAGYPLFNKKPAFCMTNGNAATATTYVNFTTTVFDTLSNCTLATGRFTAPVAGVYHFMYHQFVNNPGTGEWRISLAKNAVETNARTIVYKGTASVYMTAIVESKLSLAANDYVQVYVNTAPSALNTDPDGGWSSFSGYLL